MNMDISEEAKQAIANGQLIRARNRLRQDGCSSDDAFRKRVLLLAAERGFPPAEYAKLMRKQRTMKPLQAFCEKHPCQPRLAVRRRPQGPAADEAVGKGGPRQDRG